LPIKYAEDKGEMKHKECWVLNEKHVLLINTRGVATKRPTYWIEEEKAGRLRGDAETMMVSDSTKHSLCRWGVSSD